ncbi:ATP-binding protein [Cytobacillus sp. FJAT-54145]|uniref:histidine kinase n=1 Tax=Cytobacillus spartinae TaxID=3299023 RepID=A0ABW6KG91_9BACI
MEFQLDDILLQVLMVMFPVVLYLAMVKDSFNERKKRIWLGVTCAISMLLSFTVAIDINEGIFLDLRLVPWFIAYIYGGNLVGIVVTVFFIIVRFLIGGIGMVPAFANLLLVLLVIQFFKKRYHIWPFRKKVTFSVSFLLIASTSLPFIGSIMIGEPFTYVKSIIYIIFIAENAIVGWLMIYLIELSKEKTQLVREVHRAEKLNVVGQLAASVAHEIRNPMTSIRGFMQLLYSSKNLTEQERQYVTISLDELNRANSIIDDYLSLGREYKLEDQQRIDLAFEINRSINSLSSYANLRNVKLTFQERKPAYIIGSAGRIQQLFVNLIKNGVEATKGIGEVTITLDQNEKEVIILISDNGVGMKPEQIENLGLPFYSTKEKGTGLGLMVSLRIIEDMGGGLKVHSSLGSGTTFEISIPFKR